MWVGVLDEIGHVQGHLIDLSVAGLLAESTSYDPGALVSFDFTQHLHVFCRHKVDGDTAEVSAEAYLRRERLTPFARNVHHDRCGECSSPWRRGGHTEM